MNRSQPTGAGPGPARGYASGWVARTATEMNKLKMGVERWIGDEFFAWYNERNATQFAYFARPDRAPDLEYRDGATTLLVETTEVHYNPLSAHLLWGHLRADPRAPTEWSSPNAIDHLFIDAVKRRLEGKCAKLYPASTVLVLYHYSVFFTRSRMAEHVSRTEVPGQHPFKAIYFTASLPRSTTEDGAYECWQLA